MKAVTVRGRFLVHDDLLGDDVDNQCVSRSHIKSSWLRNDLNASVSGEILIQGWADDCSDLARGGKCPLIIIM